MAELAASVVVLTLVVVVLALRGGSSDSTVKPPGSQHPSAAASAAGTERPGGRDGSEATIEVDLPPGAVEPMMPVPLAGTVRGVDPGTSLVVEVSTEGEPWTSFPLRPVVGSDERFRTFVELGAPGVHRLRVVDPRSDTTSDVVEVRVR